MSENEDTHLKNNDNTLLKPALKNIPGESISVDWKPGDTVMGIYEVKQELGSGGFGKVFQVYHNNWKTDLAVKVPKPESFKDRTAIENFVIEAQTWVDLGLYPNIVCCYYVRTLGDVPSVFVEYIDGGSLSDWIKSGKLYHGGNEKALERILDFSIQFAWGLDYAHEMGLVHQDIKPANVMISGDGTVKVTDFGLARARALSGEKVNVKDNIMMSSGGMTPAYCSPEQASGDKISQKTDFWSFGVSLLEMFTGGVTWMSGVAAPMVLEKIIEEGSTSEEIPDIPEDVVNLLKQCFIKEPDKRVTSIRDVTEELKSIYKKLLGRGYNHEVPKAIDMRADTLNNRGVSYHDLSLFDEAKKCWEDALIANPWHLESSFNLYYFQWHSVQITSEYFIDIILNLYQKNKNNPLYFKYLSWIYLEVGDDESLQKTFKNYDLSKDKELQRMIELKKRPHAGLINIFEAKGQVVLTKDGGLVLCGGSDGSLILYEIASGTVVKNFKGHNSSINNVVISADNSLALSTAEDWTIKMWSLKSGQKIWEYQGEEHVRYDGCFDPEARYILVYGFYQNIQLHNVFTGELIWQKNIPECYIHNIKIDPAGKYFAVTGRKQIILGDLVSGSQIVSHKIEWVKGYYMEFDPSGRFLLWSEKNILFLCDLTDNFKINTLEFSYQIKQTTFSHDCSMLLLVIWDNSIRIISMHNLKEIRAIYEHPGQIEKAFFTDDDSYIISWVKEHIISLWNTKYGLEIMRFKGHHDHIWQAHVSPDNRFLVSGSSPLRLWDIKQGRELCCFKLDRGYAQECRFINNGTRILAKYWFEFKTTFWLWEIDFPDVNWRNVHPFPVLSFIKQVTLLSDINKKAKSLKTKAQMLIKNKEYKNAYSILSKCREFPEYENDTDILTLINQCGILGSGKRIALKNTFFVRPYTGHTTTIYSVSFYPDGSKFASASGDYSIRLWDFLSSREIKRIDTESQVLCICFSPNGKIILTSDFNGVINIWDTVKGTKLNMFQANERPISSISCSPCGNYVLSGGDDKIMRLWEIKSGKVLLSFEGHTDKIKSVAISGDSRYALSGSDDNTIKLWGLKNGKLLKNFKAHDSFVYSVSFSSDMRYILSGSWDKTIKLQNIKNGKINKVFKSDTEYIRSVCMTPDLSFMLSTAFDNTIHLWDVVNGTEIKSIEGHKGFVETVAFSPDYSHIISGGNDNIIRLNRLDWEWDFSGRIF